MAVIALDTEDAAWTALKQLLDGSLDVSELIFDLENAEWINFKLKLEGKKFRQSLTASVMKGLVEYQFANYRSIALITKNKPNAGILTDTQKDKYELTFKISGGSTETNADGKGIAEALNSQAAVEAVKKMDKKHIFILVLVYLLMSYGQGIYAEHLKSVTEAQRIESADKRDARQTEAADKRDARQQETIDKLILSDKEKAKLLEKAISKNDKAGDIVEMHEKAADTILKNTSDAEYVILQGRKIDREQLDQLNKQIRRRPQVIFLDSEFLVKANQPLDTGGFNITVEDTRSGNVFVAALVDPLVLEKSRKPIQDAEWNLKPVRLHIRAKDKGDGPYEAEIVKAFRQKK